jgi:EAL domain-containing protein (putative c-di-GMP-specific phosphodiesterase class I)/GGDEF domain-containing protein
MPSDSLLQSLPDLVVCLRRDGVVLALDAGHGVGKLRPAANSIGRNINEIWPETVATLIRQLARKSLASRLMTEARFQDHGRDYEARVSAQGPDRTICIIRALGSESTGGSTDATGERLGPQIERRGFLRRLKESAALAALKEKAMAVAVIHVGGISDLAHALAPELSEQIMTAAILRLPSHSPTTDKAKPAFYLGQLSDCLLALAIETSDTHEIEACIEEVCTSLRKPVNIGADVFHLRPSAGIAVLGQDASSARALLQHARAAANEARRSGTGRFRFFTDDLQVQALARIDMARELRDAIANRDIRLRYVGRHDLASGRLVAMVAYMRWVHPLRGEIRPAEFLPVVESIGLANTLSNASLRWLREDYAALSDGWDPHVRISFGALRHHLSHQDFVGELESFLSSGAVPPERLELRVAENNLGVRRPNDFKSLANLGVQLVVDEVGRDVAPLDWLARAPAWGIQIDRTWTVAARTDAVALKVCRAVVGVARGLGLSPIAPGVDDRQQWQALTELGFAQGSGDLYPNVAPDIIQLGAANNSI